MKLHRFCLLVLPLLVLSLSAPSAHADILGSAASYVVLAGTTVTNAFAPADDTLVTGNMGVSPGSACTGFILGNGCLPLGAGIVSGTTNLGAAAAGPVADAMTAYGALATTPGALDITGQTLGVGSFMTVNPGVYHSNDSVLNLIGTLTLDGLGDPNALWIFQTAFALTTAPGSSVALTGAGTGAGVYFQIGSQATLGDNSLFQGNILAGTAIAFNPGARITCGRAFAQSAVTFAGQSSAPLDNAVGFGNCSVSASGFNGGTIIPPTNGESGTVGPGTGGTPVSTPEPGTLLLFGTGIAGLVGKVRMGQARERSHTAVA